MSVKTGLTEKYFLFEQGGDDKRINPPYKTSYEEWTNFPESTGSYPPWECTINVRDSPSLTTCTGDASSYGSVSNID